MSFRDLPINRKLTRVIMAITLSALLLTGSAAVVFEWIVYRKELIQRAETFAELLAESCAAPLMFNDPDIARGYLSGLRSEDCLQQATVYDTDGHAFARFPQNATLAPLKIQPGQTHRRMHRTHFEIFQPVVYNRERQGTLHLQATFAPLFDRLKLFSFLILAVLIFSSVLAFGLSRFLARTISRPILSLAGAARKVS